MSKQAKSILIVIIVIILIIAAWLLFRPKATAPATQTQAVSTTASITPVPPMDSSDASIEQDMANINTQMTSLDSDNVGTDQSLQSN